MLVAAVQTWGLLVDVVADLAHWERRDAMREDAYSRRASAIGSVVAADRDSIALSSGEDTSGPRGSRTICA